MKECKLLVNKKAYTLCFDCINDKLKVKVKDSHNKPIPNRMADIIVGSFFNGYHETKKAFALSLYEKDGCPVKRYFDTDGIENYELFLNKNNFNEMQPIILNIPKLKIFNFINISLNAISLVILISMFSSNLEKKEKEKNYYQTVSYLEEVVDDSFNEDYLYELLKQNPYLSDKCKEFLLSNNFLRDVAKTDMSNEQKAIICYNLRNLNIKEFDQLYRIILGIEELRTGNRTEAFVEGTDYNKSEILIRDSENKLLPYIIPHEFAHTIQSNDTYPYLTESVAELIAHEYWDRPVFTYHDSIKRIYVLMEIIGQKPVWNAFFNSPKELEESIISILGEEDGQLLLAYLKNKPYESNYNEGLEEYENNLKIDILLKRMYEKKYNKSIESDELIKAIYHLRNNGNLLFILDKEIVEVPIYYFDTDKKEDLDYLITSNRNYSESTPEKQKSLTK